MTMREQTCCFTGHRDIPSTQRQALVENLEGTVRQLIARGVRYFNPGNINFFFLPLGSSPFPLLFIYRRIDAVSFLLYTTDSLFAQHFS